MIKRYKVNPDLKVLAKTELKEKERIRYKEWSYILGKVCENKAYEITPERGEQFWRLLFNYHYHLDISRVQSKNPQEGMGNAWWICLR